MKGSTHACLVSHTHTRNSIHSSIPCSMTVLLRLDCLLRVISRASERLCPMYLDLIHWGSPANRCSLITLAQSCNAEMCKTSSNKHVFLYIFKKQKPRSTITYVKTLEQNIYWNSESLNFKEEMQFISSVPYKLPCERNHFRSSDVRHMNIDSRQFSFSSFCIFLRLTKPHINLDHSLLPKRIWSGQIYLGFAIMAKEE